ncbi:MAG: glycerol-3-phosphate 1-O-acyltransferase PlsY [Gammaproteobacteria bacterium]|nr:glycerol-3-phosphate 1-O-acyltransferase PlsY [Gammaproteobacteria bacterium]
MFIAAILIVAAYLLGSLASAILVCRSMGLPDPRDQGSRNPGATNVLRYGGKKAAAMTLLFDVLKGFIAVWGAGQVTANESVLSMVALAAFLGHLYPAFFGFHGGKGVAVSLGVLTGLAWPVGLTSLITWLLMAGLFRYSSLSALAAALLAPFYTLAFTDSLTYTGTALILSVLLFWCHRTNIRDLLKGLESKIGEK